MSTLDKGLDMIKPVLATVAGIGTLVPFVAPFAPLLKGLADLAGELVADRKLTLDAAKARATVIVNTFVDALGTLRTEVTADDAAAIREAAEADRQGTPV